MTSISITGEAEWELWTSGELKTDPRRISGVANLAFVLDPGELRRLRNTNIAGQTNWPALVLAPGLLNLQKAISISGTARWPNPVLESELRLYFLTYSEQSETPQTDALRGAIILTAGPGFTIAVAASESRGVAVLSYLDRSAMRVVAFYPLGARVLEIVSSPEYLWALTEGTRDPGGEPRLVCFKRHRAGLQRFTTRVLDRKVQPRMLWGPNNSRGIWPGDGYIYSDFLLLTGDEGAVEICTADAAMQTLIRQETGIYQPRTCMALRRTDLEDEDEEIWHCMLLSERSARGVTLEYRVVRKEVEVSYLEEGAPAVKTVDATRRFLRVIQEFDAPHAEGPIRLFRDQTLFYRPYEPVALAVGGAVGVSAYAIAGSPGSFNVNPAAGTLGGMVLIQRALGLYRAIGSDERVLYRNRGPTFTSWEPIPGAPTAPLSVSRGYTGADVDGVSGRIIFCGGETADEAVLVYSDDDGDTWTEVQIPSALGGCFRSIAWIEDETWMAVGRAGGAEQPHIALSTDGGLTWSPRPGAGSSSTTYNDLIWSPEKRILVLLPNASGRPPQWSEDFGLTVTPGEGDVNVRPFNGAYSPELGLFAIERDSPSGPRFAWSEDGKHWETANDPYDGVSVDTSDLAWIDVVDPPYFLAVGRTSPSLHGSAAFSVDGKEWTQVYLGQPAVDPGFFFCGPVSPAPLRFEPGIKTAVERYEQVQAWAIQGAPDPGFAEQLRRDQYRGEGLREVDTDWPEVQDIPATDADDYVVDPDGISRPRYRTARILGGYVVFHGAQGVAHRVWNRPEELPLSQYQELAVRGVASWGLESAGELEVEA